MNTPSPLRIVVVDDSALFRLLIRDVLQSIPGCTVVGHAENGRVALNVIKDTAPDLVTLDVEMPEMDGIATLRALKRRGFGGKVLMVSRHTVAGASITTDALLEGAFDFVLKPTGKNPAENRAALHDAFEQKIRALSKSDELADPVVAPPEETAIDLPTSGKSIRAVIIGLSTGGPDSLKKVLPKLSSDLPVPVIVVQHMPPDFTATLAERLNNCSAITVAEAHEGESLRPGSVLIAPGGRQMRIQILRNGDRVVRLTDDPPEHGCRPAVDYVLRSAVEAFDGQILSVIMTGMGHDGTAGCRLVREQGGQVIAQHADGCVVYGMPKSVISNKLAHRVVKLEFIAAVINREVGR